MGIGRDVGLLHDVFDLALVLHDRPGYSIDAAVVPAHQHFEERRIAREHPFDDLLVRQRVIPR
jgi:hypothetical protein